MPKIPENLVVDRGGGEDETHLRSYRYHGLDLAVAGSQAFATCPFCGRERKFTIDTSNGLWRCLVCGTGSDAGGGNPLTFLRLLWDRSDAATSNADYDVLAAERKFADPLTLNRWGCCRSVIDRAWMVPGYAPDGRLYQLYRLTTLFEDGKYVKKLLPTPGIWPPGRSHAIHGVFPLHDYDEIWICEGPWDGMALWEVMARTKRTTDGLAFTGSEATSMLANEVVIAVPGCNVFRDDWLQLVSGKVVNIAFDSDHPRLIRGKKFMAGHDGAKRLAKVFAGMHSPPKAVRWLRWGPEGFDPALKTGFDVRDLLTEG